MLSFVMVNNEIIISYLYNGLKFLAKGNITLWFMKFKFYTVQ